jgi:hypothetical protein
MNRALRRCAQPRSSAANLLCFTAANKKSTKENSRLKQGLNDMTSLTALLCNWPLVGQIRERADGTGLEKIG